MHKMAPIIISLEGNIGAGKSTLLMNLSKAHPEWCFVYEPVDEWMQPDFTGRTLLQNFYEDKRRWAYTLQNAALMSRSKALIDAIEGSECKVFVTERSIDADKNTFAKMLVADGNMTPLESSLYEKTFEQVVKVTPKVSGFIHLDTPVTICQDRIHKRGRAGEAIEVEYLDALDSYHFAWLHSAKNRTPVLRYDTYSMLKDQTTLKDVEAFVTWLSSKDEE